MYGRKGDASALRMYAANVNGRNGSKSNEVRCNLSECALRRVAIALTRVRKLDVPIVAGGVTDSSNGNFCKYFRSITRTRSAAGFIVTFVLSNTPSRYLVQFH